MAIGSCATDDVLENEALFDGEIISSLGRWQIPDSVMEISNPYQIEYDNVPSPGSPELCPGQLLPGASALKQFLESEHTTSLTVSGYNCESSSQGNRFTMHSTGRALDLYLNVEEGPSRDEFGDSIANWMIVNAQDIGIQEVIWNRTIWNASRPTSPVNLRQRPYIVLDPHRNHIHIDLNNAAASMDTPFFGNNGGSGQPMPPSSSSTPNSPGNSGGNPQSQEAIFASLMPQGCLVLPAGGGTIDNGNPCMQLEGDPSHWNFSDDNGFENADYAWTQTTTNPNSSEAGVWYVRLGQPQAMIAEVYVPTPELSHQQTNYFLDTPFGSRTIVADLANASLDGWVSLGELNLANDNLLKVSSYTEAASSSALTVPVDALRLYPPGQRPEIFESDDDSKTIEGKGCNLSSSNSSVWGLISLLLLALVARPKKRRS